MQTSGRVSPSPPSDADAGSSAVASAAFPCLSPEQALAYVAGGASGADSATYAPASIQSHIDDCDSCRRVLAEAVRSATETAPAGAAFRTLADGQRLLGRYEIKRFIARGGMGEVYEAFDTALGERVALKTLLPTALDDQRAIDRLADEVRLARKVTHPNVCRILELGVYQLGGSGVGIPFLTMEFLTGESLSRRIAAEGSLPPATVSKLVADVVAGLAAIHDSGIVHRDLKSANVFLVRGSNGDERAVIMDFGLARGVGEDLRRGSSTGAAGTPDYMAPEQVEGKPATRAFDIYALGVVMFEMLTGRKPFEGASPYMAALSRLHRRAPAPSTLAPGLPPAWDAVVGRCLERQPERRFSRVEDITASLRATLGNWRAPRPIRMASYFGIAGLLALGTVALGRQVLRAPRPSSPPATVAAPSPVDRSPPPAPTPQPLLSSPPAPAVEARPAAVRPRTGGARPRSQPNTDPAPEPSRPALAAAPATASPPAAPGARELLQEAEGLMLAGDVASACQLGEKAAALTPPPPAAERFLGKCYIRLGNSAAANRHHRRYLELAPDAPDAVFIRAILESAR